MRNWRNWCGCDAFPSFFCMRQCDHIVVVCVALGRVYRGGHGGRGE